MKTDKRCGTSEERVENCFAEQRTPCKDCGSLFWFSCPTSWVCVKCCKTHGKSGSEEQEFKWIGDEAK